MMKKWQQLTLAFAFIALIVAIVFRVLTSMQKYFVVGSNFTTTEPISILHRFDFKFNKTISSDFIKTCKLSFSPDVKFSITANSDVLQIEPTTRLKAKTRYSLKGTCDYVLFDFVFETGSTESLSDEEIQMLQTQLDYEFATELKETYRSKPWLEGLPITTTYYELVYSYSENLYLVHLTLPPKNPPTKDELTADIKKRLAEIGAPELEIFWR